MPNVICPTCLRRIELSEQDLSLATIICAECETSFAPVTKPWATEAPPATWVAHDEPQRWYHSPANVFFLVTGAILAAGFISWLLFTVIAAAILRG